MQLKTSLIITLCCWGVIGFFYVVHLIKITHVIEGVFRELLLLPAFLGAAIFSGYSLILIVKKVLIKR